MRSGRGQGFDSPHLHVTSKRKLTEAEKKDVNEKADAFKRTLGSNKPAKEK